MKRLCALTMAVANKWLNEATDVMNIKRHHTEHRDLFIHQSDFSYKLI